MRLIKLALLSFIFLFGLITLISLLIPGQVRISKAVNIHREAKDSIHPLIAGREAWVRWHPFFMDRGGGRLPADLKTTMFTVNDSTVLADLQRGDNLPIRNGWQWHAHAGSDSLTLQWYMDFRLRWYPWQKFGSLFYEGTYGAVMEEGLSNLKKHER